MEGGVALIKFLGGLGCVLDLEAGNIFFDFGRPFSGTHFYTDFYGFLDPFGPPSWTSLASFTGTFYHIDFVEVF